MSLPKPEASRDHPIYGVFPYNAKKPYNIVNHCVLKSVKLLFNKGITFKEKIYVSDPFMGSGITVIESLYISSNNMYKGRIRVTGFDLNPYATFIVETLLFPTSYEERSSIRKIIKEIYEKVVNKYYVVKDLETKRQAILLEEHYIGDKPNPLEREWKLVAVKLSINGYEIYYVAKGYRGKIHLPQRANVKEVSKEKLEKFNSFNIDYPSSEYINWKLVENTRIRIYKGMHTKHLFTPRNAHAIVTIRNIINKYGRFERKVLLGVLAACIHLSKLTDYKRQSAQSWYIPRIDAVSLNVAKKFVEKGNELLTALAHVEKLWRNLGWDISNKDFNAKDFGEVTTDKFVLIKTAPADTINEIIGEKNIDIIHTDPPYADQVPYLEYYMPYVNILGLMSYEEYIKLFNKEIILSDSPERPNKKRNTKEGLENYVRGFMDSFNAIGRSLRTEGILQLWYAVKEREEWNALLKSIERQGFQLNEIYVVPRPLKTFVQTIQKAKDVFALVRGSEMLLEYRKVNKVKPRVMLDEKTAEKLFIETIEEQLKKGFPILGIVSLEFVRRCLIKYYQPPPRLNVKETLEKHGYTVKKMKIKSLSKEVEVIVPSKGLRGPLDNFFSSQ